MKYQFYISIATMDGHQFKEAMGDPIPAEKIVGTLEEACERGLSEVMDMGYIMLKRPKGRRAVNLKGATCVDIWAEVLKEEE